VELFHGHPALMHLLDMAAAGQVMIVLPANAILEAAAVMNVDAPLWDHFLRFEGINDLPLATHAAIAAGEYARPRVTNPTAHRALTSPLQVANVLQEAYAMRAIIVTAIPYRTSKMAMKSRAVHGHGAGAAAPIQDGIKAQSDRCGVGGADRSMRVDKVAVWH
jgi:hypothetical protein